MRISLSIAAFLAIAGCQQKAPEQPTNNQAAAAPEGVGVKGVHRDHKGEMIPDVKILNATGKEARLPDLLDGRPLLVNLWASWCAPCVKELPTLRGLVDHGRVDLAVMPISQDSGPQKSVEAFLRNLRLDFVPFQDPKMKLSGALGPDTVLPTTILYDSKGREVWRYVGDLDWTSPEAAKLLSEADASPKAG